MTITIDTSVLLGYYNAKAGVQTDASGNPVSPTAGATGSTSSKKTPVPTAPWASASGAPPASDLVRQVMAGQKFIDPTAAKLDVAGASNDYRQMFALYQGLSALNGLAQQAGAKGVGPTQLADLQKTFASGMSQVSTYLDTLKLDQIRIARGAALTKDQTAVGAPKDNATYETGVLYQGPSTGQPDAFQGDVAFTISVKKVNSTVDVPINLNDMGSTPRTMSNVVSYLNNQFQAAGVVTRFAVDHQVGQPQTVQIGGKPFTLPAGPDQWSLKIKGDIAETLTFSAAATAHAVYMTQAAGDAGQTDQQLLKFQTDTTQTPAPPPAVGPPGQPFSVDGRAFAESLGSEVSAARATASALDGSVYVLADVTGTTDGQTLQGAQDVALQKYDSAGKLIFTRTLGAASSASGFALSVAADGKVAIAGSVTGALTPGDAGVDATKPDSFVTVFDSQGQELWTQRRAAREADQANVVAFGADGTVYVAGQAKSNMPGASAVGGQDGYVEGFQWNGLSGDASKVTTRFTTQFGTAGQDKATSLAVNGTSLIVGGMDGSHGVLRAFDVSSGSATLTATRDLGDMMGGQIAGISMNGGQLVVAGTTGNAALDAGTATAAFSGGTTDAFAASLSADLQPAAGDQIAYFGGSGTDTATALAVADGQVYIAGASNADLPGLVQVGAQDGYLARIDIASGAVGWAQRFTAQDGAASPTSIAIDSTGASALDRLGLPKGPLSTTSSQLVTANTSVRAGDQFLVKTREGGQAATVTIAQDDTLDTLAKKISRAAGFQVKTSIITDGDFHRLKIEALNDRSTVEILAGKGGKDALAALGLQEGVVQTASTGSSGAAAKTKKTYGLALDPDLSLATPDAIKAAQSQLTAAMGAIQRAYNDLKAASQPKPPPSASGTAPAYLKNQIANYQAALARLTGTG